MEVWPDINPLDMTPLTVSHHIHCSGCEQPITVIFQPITVAQAYDPATEQPYACSDGCDWTERPRLQGQILRVWAGHGPDPDPQ